MRIIEDCKAGTFTLIPVNFGERMLVKKLLDTVNRNLKYEYHGHAKNSTEESKVLRFNVGGTPYRKVMFYNGKKLGTTDGYKGGTNFRVRASDEESREALGGIRDMCFFASGGLLFLREAQVDNTRSIVCTGAFCKSCGSPIIGISAARENLICSECSDGKCEHEYKKTVLLTPTFGLIETEACTKCKRMSPAAFERAKQTPKLQRLAEAQAHLRALAINAHLFLGRPGDNLNMSVDEAVALRDNGAVPECYKELVATVPEAKAIFDDIAKDFQERI